MKVLVVAPHPDDEVLGCGGTIARHVAEGDTVDVQIVTRGDLSYDQAWIDESREEALRAHALLGVSVTWMWDFPSPTLDTVPFSEIVETLRRNWNRADVVYVPARGDLHQEHRIVHEACMVAFRPPGPDIYAYETPSETENGYGFAPNHFVDITGYMPKKLAAMQVYQTQLKTPPHPRSLLSLEVLAEYRGSTIQVDYAEAFETVRTFR